MIQFNGKQIYNFFLTWCMGLIFLFSSYTFMEDVLYRKFLGLNFDNPLLAVIMCISALFFGATMAYVGVYCYDMFLQMRNRRKQIELPLLGDMVHELEIHPEWHCKKEKKKLKKILDQLHMTAMFFGTSTSCLIIFLTKLCVEIRFYNYSNIQYTLMFLVMVFVFKKEMDKLYKKIELVRNTCMNETSDIL